MLSYVPNIAGVIGESDFFARESKGRALRENMYTLDLRIRQEAISFLRISETQLDHHYSELVMV